MTKYLVTGAAGHLGLNLVKELTASNEKVKALVLPNEKNIINIPSEVEIVYGDVTNKDSLKQFFDNKDCEVIVIHCAGIVSIASKYNELVHKVNVEGTKNIVDMCIDNNVKKLVYVSSVHAIKEKPNKEVITETMDFNPEDVVGLYAKTKSEATNYVLKSRDRGLDTVVVHPSGIIGPDDYGQGHITQLIIDYCNKGLTAAVKGGYDFVDVRDVTHGIIRTTKNDINNENYILSNHYFEIKILLDILAKITGKKEIKTYLPLWFAKTTAPLAETYYKLLKQPPLFTGYSLYTLESNSNFSHEKATRELDYHPREFEDTLSDTVAFLKKTKRIK